MKKRYTIYQLTKGHERKFEDLPDDVNSVNLSDYKKVWEGGYDGNKEDDKYILEDLYRIFNIDHPQGFTGHSLSVSDLVQINEKYYSCEGIGWKGVDLNG